MIRSWREGKSLSKAFYQFDVLRDDEAGFLIDSLMISLFFNLKIEVDICSPGRDNEGRAVIIGHHRGYHRGFQEKIAGAQSMMDMD